MHAQKGFLQFSVVIPLKSVRNLTYPTFRRLLNDSKWILKRQIYEFIKVVHRIFEKTEKSVLLLVKGGSHSGFEENSLTGAYK